MSSSPEVVIVGSGVGGGTLAHRLVHHGLAVTILERGDFLPREEENWDVHAVFASQKYVPEETWLDKEGNAFRPGTYYYQRRYGLTLQYFSTTGDADPGLYGPGSVSGSNNGSPNSRGYIAELNYVPIQYLRVMLQYTGYAKFNGARTDYDGAGRDASNNNTLFLNLWFAY